jgi:hypothetical protein
MTSLNTDNREKKKAFLKANPAKQGPPTDEYNFDYRRRYADIQKKQGKKPEATHVEPKAPTELQMPIKRAAPSGRTFGALHKIKKLLTKEEAVPANCVAGGKVAGLGGANGEPGVDKKKKKKTVLQPMASRKKC